MRKEVLLCVCLLLGINVWGQTQYRGKVRDAYTGTPLVGVKIFTDNQVLTESDQAGLFEIRLNERQSLGLWKGGYDTLLIASEKLTGQSTLSLALQPKERLLSQIKIKAYASERSLHKTAGAIARLNPEALQRYDFSSLLPAINTIPGVRMDSRGSGGSSRISIRGSTLRAPFGVRNLKLYWDDLPITSPDGSTPLEVMDLGLTQSIEVLKGPTGSLYGAGTGGTLLLSTPKSQLLGTTLSQQLQAGSYDALRSQTKLSASTLTSQLQVGYVRSRNEGYREQEYVDKDLFHFHWKIYPKLGQSLSLYAYYFEGGWGLPGALTLTQAQENPRQAVAFSQEANASLFRKRVRVGATYTQTLSPQWRLSTTSYTNFTEKDNPFGTTRFFNGINIESAQGLGNRSYLQYQGEWGSVQTSLTLGTELQTELNMLQVFDNVQGQTGALEEDNHTRSSIISGFAQAEWEFPTGLIATAGASLNRVRYDFSDFFLPDSIDLSRDIRISPAFAPRLALLQALTPYLSAHASVSFGFSPPSLWEVLSPSGALNADLESERGINYEVGIRGSVWDGKLELDLSVYRMVLEDAILPTVLPSGETRFNNAGTTRQEGVELMLRVNAIEESAQREIQALRFWVSAAYQPYRFRDFVKEGDDLNGNRLPGVPNSTAVAGIDFALKAGAYLNLTYRFEDELALNDANTEFSDAYSVLDLKTGWRGTLGKYINWEAYAGVNNLTDTFYTSFWQVNGFGGKYFNPAPGRNFFGGLSLSYRFP